MFTQNIQEKDVKTSEKLKLEKKIRTYTSRFVTLIFPKEVK